MSIVVLKRKSRRYQEPISGRKNGGFALNGTRRNIGAVGPTNLGKSSVTRTRFRGAEPMGSGGCCGGYKRVINNSGSCCVNDSSIVKLSAKNTRGMIDTKYKWTKSAWPRTTTKPQDSMPDNYTQGQHIKNVVANNSICVVNKQYGGIKQCADNCKSASYHIGGKKKVFNFYSKNLNPVPVSSSEYQRGFLMKKTCLPTPACRGSFPMELIHNGCDTNFFTPEEAIKGGMLPKNWGRCPPDTRATAENLLEVTGTCGATIQVSRHTGAQERPTNPSS